MDEKAQRIKEKLELGKHKDEDWLYQWKRGFYEGLMQAANIIEFNKDRYTIDEILEKINQEVRRIRDE